jgi:hypothetical protein
MDKKELSELGKSNLDRVFEALDEGNIEEARRRVLIMEKEAKHAHDLMISYVWILLTYIGSRFGDEEVIKALRFRHDCIPQVAEKMLGMSVEETVRYKAMLQRGHHSTIRITEEEDRFVMELDPCNTGGRSRREGLDRPPINLGKTKKGFPESWGRSSVSYYCAHCGLLSLIGMEKGEGHPSCIYECPKDPNDPCRQIFYKRPENVPEKYVDELGVGKKIKGKK